MLDVFVFSDRTLVRQLGTVFENPLLAERQRACGQINSPFLFLLETAGWRGALAHS